MSLQKTKIHSSISEISPEHWDAILSPADVFHTHRFIQVIELAQVENSRCWPVCFYEEGALVATAVLSAFRVDLGIFLGEKIKSRIDVIRRRFPHFMKPEILFCGLPVSLGQRNLIIARPESTDGILERLDETMRDIAQKHQLKYFAIKEFDQKTCREWSVLSRLGYFKGNSIPYMDMDIKWPSFSVYLNELKHTYRRQITKSLKKIQPIIFDPIPNDDISEKAIVRLNQWDHCPPSLFYELYLKVMDRAETKMETLNLAFFEHCFEQLRADLTLITVEKSGEVLSAGLLFHHPPYLSFALVGNKYEKLPDSDPYFNLIHAMIELAVKLEVKQLKLGQTAYWVKQRVGGQPSGRFLYFKAKNSILHLVLKSLRKELFPETHIPSVYVFKSKSTPSV